jgi:NTP pyrophosphatase (non-canonical NTP hydrolase)
MNIEELTQAQVKFRDERDWAQFHTLRNLIVSLHLEASELLELTQWKSDPEIAAMPNNDKQMEALQDECADVLFYLLLIAEKGGFDLLRAAAVKLEKNALKYPVEKSFGSSRKYTELD